MAYYQSSYEDDDPETRRRMRALAGLDPEDGEPAPTVQLTQPAQPPPTEQPTPRLEPALPQQDPRERAMFELAGRGAPPERELTERERQADRDAIDAEGEAKFGGVVNDLGVLAALVADIAGNRGRGIGKLGGAWAQGKMQAADRDRAIAQRNQERAQDSADRTAERTATWEHADASQGRDIASREMLNREDQDAATGRTKLQIEAESARSKAQAERDALQFAETKRVNDSTIADREHDNKEGDRHSLEAERQGRIGLGISAQAHADAAAARADALRFREEDKAAARNDKQEQRDLMHSHVPGIGVHNEEAWAASNSTAGAREKSVEARTGLGGAADAMADMVDIRKRIGIGNPQKDAADITRFEQAKARYIGALGASSGAGKALSDKEFQRLAEIPGSITFGSRDVMDALASPLYGFGQDTQLQKLQGAYADIVGQVNARLGAVGGHYERIPTDPRSSPPDPSRAPDAPKPPKPIPYRRNMYSNPEAGR
jgi:hypothetical protein